jgi:glycosyltransferase involved in cell wall biosynthesis
MRMPDFGPDVARRPFVSVIVPVRDDPRLADCLAAVRLQDYGNDRFEVVVADNGSTGDVAGVVARAFDGSDIKSRVVSEPDGGSYSARNAAVAVAAGEVLAFTDADCIPSRSWIRAGVQELTSGADVIAGRVHVFARDSRRPHPVEAYEIVHAFPQSTYVARGGGCITANLMTTREVFDANGPFWSALKSGADIEWGQRAAGKGFAVTYSADAVVSHPARRSFGDLHRKLVRVLSGRFERDVLSGTADVMAWPPLRAWIPPIGSALRSIRDDRLASNRARVAVVVGEFFYRYAAAATATRLAYASRRSAGTRVSLSADPAS